MTLKEKGIDKQMRALQQRIQPKYIHNNKTTIDFSRRRNREHSTSRTFIKLFVRTRKRQ